MQKSSLNTHTKISSGIRGLNSGQCFYLHSYFVYVNSEFIGESVYLRRLAWPMSSLLDGAMSITITFADPYFSNG